MRTRLRKSSAMVFAIVASVLPVSGFAQTNNRVESVLARSSATVVRRYVADRGPAHEITPLPANLIVSDVYRPVVEMMRERSPTFRRQCAKIAAASELRVVIEVAPPALSARPTALTHVQRYEYGRIVATVKVSTSTRTPELIAHELEHVLEQLDGVDLAAKARLRSSGVRVCECGAEMTAFETTRAVAAGLRVADEVARN